MTTQLWTHADAVLSDCGQYRYVLSRAWDLTKDQLCFCMLNPSTADALQDDPTIRRCLGFAHQWGYGSLVVVNLFAFRATSPTDLQHASHPVGPVNDKAILEAVEYADTVIAAWGVHGQYLNRDAAVMELLRDHDVYYLGCTQDGSPKHPLYLRRDVLPQRYWGR